jgi:hypothetical protein
MIEHELGHIDYDECGTGPTVVLNFELLKVWEQLCGLDSVCRKQRSRPVQLSARATSGYTVL